MKKFLKVLIGLVLAIIIIWEIIFLIDYNRCSNFKEPIFILKRENEIYYGLGYKVLVEDYRIEMYINNKFITGAIADVATPIQENTVVIKNGRIENENLIDEFIVKAGKSEKIELEIAQDEDKIKLVYIPGQNAGDKEATYNLPNITDEDSTEIYKKIYGEYVLTINDVEVYDVDALRFSVSRRNDGNDVYLTFKTIGTICLDKPMDICKYDLDSSSYKENFEVAFYQRKDLGIKKVYEGEYNVYTYGGDVDIIIEKDMAYKLEDALSKNVIKPDEIIEQAKMDEKYGLCEARYYKDGGSIEYGYFKGFTILKYNTLEENTDIVIGMNGQIINNVNEKLYNK